MNDIIERASEEVRDLILGNADCCHKYNEPEYGLYPLKEKETILEVQKIIWGAIEQWVNENIISEMRASDE